MSKTKRASEYQVNISYDARDNIYVARVPELDNCHSHGNTPEEALTNVHEAVVLWIETAKQEGIPIPPPISRKKYSGRFVLRTSRDTHAELAKEALRRGKSLNEFVVDFIQFGLKRSG